MKKLILFILLAGCNPLDESKELKTEIELLKNQNDSLENELQKCDMILDAYEGLPMSI